MESNIGTGPRMQLDFDTNASTFSRALAHLDTAATKQLDAVGFDRRLRELVRIRASQLNGCAYCVDMHSKDARAGGTQFHSWGRASNSRVEKLRTIVDGIPVVLVRPDVDSGRDAVLWMSHLGGSAEKTMPMLRRFAAAGHPAVSFDAVGHGARGSGDPWAFATEVLGAFRRRMWPILVQTTLEAMRVLTWPQEQTGHTGDAMAGGVSMGGDVAVALAGIDERVGRVASIGSTPNWSRPDMRELADPSQVIDQGLADPYAQWFADNLDPRRHFERYRRGVAITFELGGADHHVPVENASMFITDLRQLDPTAAAHLRVQMYPGLDHLGVTTSDTSLTAAAQWLLADRLHTEP